MEASPGLRRASEPESDEEELVSLDSTVVESARARPFSVSFAPEVNPPPSPRFAPSAPLADPSFEFVRAEARLRPSSLTLPALASVGGAEGPSLNTRSRRQPLSAPLGPTRRTSRGRTDLTVIDRPTSADPYPDATSRKSDVVSSIDQLVQEYKEKGSLKYVERDTKTGAIVFSPVTAKRTLTSTVSSPVPFVPFVPFGQPDLGLVGRAQLQPQVPVTPLRINWGDPRRGAIVTGQQQSDQQTREQLAFRPIQSPFPAAVDAQSPTMAAASGTTAGTGATGGATGGTAVIGATGTTEEFEGNASAFTAGGKTPIKSPLKTVPQGGAGGAIPKTTLATRPSVIETPVPTLRGRPSLFDTTEYWAGDTPYQPYKQVEPELSMLELEIDHLKDQLTRGLVPPSLKKKKLDDLRKMEEDLASEYFMEQVARERAERGRITEEDAYNLNQQRADEEAAYLAKKLEEERRLIQRERELIEKEKAFAQKEVQSRSILKPPPQPQRPNWDYYYAPASERQSRPTSRATGPDPMKPTSRRSSSERVVKLSSVITHIVKPVANLMDPTKRDDPGTRARNIQHLNELDEQIISNALYEEPVIKGLLSNHAIMRREIDRLKTESRTSARALAEKTGALSPNADYMYPLTHANETAFAAAVKAMQAKVRVIERGTTFQQAPYNFVAELCSESNNVASNFALSKDQQRELILSYVPSQSPTYHALKRSGTLEGIFRAATDGSSKICTRAELGKQIADWTLDNSSAMNLTSSVDRLLVLIEQQEGEPKTITEHVALYRRAIQRIKGINLPAFVAQLLDEADIRIIGEENIMELMRHIMAPLRKCIGIKLGQRHERQVKATKVKVIQEKPVQKPPQQQQQQQKQQPQQQQQQQKQPQQQQQQKKLFDGQQQFRSNNQNKNRQNKTSSFVAQWPVGKSYMSQSGNKLSKECEAHFANFCFKCGHNSHAAQDCRFYTDNITYLTLCDTCRQGFHAKCKSPRYTKYNRSYNRSSGNQMDGMMVKAIEASVTKAIEYQLGAKTKSSKKKKEETSSDDSE